MNIFRICCLFAATSIFEALSTVMATALCSLRISFIGQAWEHTKKFGSDFLIVSLNGLQSPLYIYYVSVDRHGCKLQLDGGTQLRGGNYSFVPAAL